MIVSSRGGIVIRQHASEIRVAGRNTQGVRLIKLGEGDSVSDVASVMAEDQDLPAEGGKPARGEKENGEGPADEKKNLKTPKAEAGKTPAKKGTAVPKKTRKPPPRRTSGAQKKKRK